MKDFDFEDIFLMDVDFDLLIKWIFKKIIIIIKRFVGYVVYLSNKNYNKISFNDLYIKY